MSHDYLIADPRRIEKVKNFKFPNDKKGMRAFLGLINSLHRVTNVEVFRQSHILTPLTSSKNAYEPTEIHRKAFNEVITMMISSPLYGNLIDERADKYIYVDAASSTGVLGGVLLQKIGNSSEKYVPECLNLEDEVHSLIYDHQLPYEPAKLYTSLPIELPKPS